MSLDSLKGIGSDIFKSPRRMAAPVLVEASEARERWFGDGMLGRARKRVQILQKSITLVPALRNDAASSCASV